MGCVFCEIDVRENGFGKVSFVKLVFEKTASGTRPFGTESIQGSGSGKVSFGRVALGERPLGHCTFAKLYIWENVLRENVLELYVFIFLISVQKCLLKLLVQSFI